MGNTRVNEENIYSDNTPKIIDLAKTVQSADQIDPELFTKHDVKRGLRDLNGKGVLTGLTNISTIIASEEVNGERIPTDGNLYYRGINVRDIVHGTASTYKYGFEEAAYLLLFGQLPSESELKGFAELLGFYRSLPTGFVRDIIMKAPSRDMMNTLSRSVLTLYSYDDHADDVSMPNVLRQCLQMISLFPLLAIYGYQAYNHYHEGKSLYLLRPDSKYTELEARLLDICLILHMEHGGGNNSSFTTHVVSSSMTDSYSVIAAAIGSLKGPRHGGANIKVIHMFDAMEKDIKDWSDEEEVKAYLKKLLHGEAFDKAGLIYGVGHAIYSKSDPRAVLLKEYTIQLAKEKGMEKELALYETVERLAPEVISAERRMYKGVSINVDFYSGFVYKMLGLPEELFTPMFAIARIVGWSAHRMEELANNSKIIRPAYMAVSDFNDYVPMDKR